MRTMPGSCSSNRKSQRAAFEDRLWSIKQGLRAESSVTQTGQPCHCRTQQVAGQLVWSCPSGALARRVEDGVKAGGGSFSPSGCSSEHLEMKGSALEDLRMHHAVGDSSTTMDNWNLWWKKFWFWQKLHVWHMKKTLYFSVFSSVFCSLTNYVRVMH